MIYSDEDRIRLATRKNAKWAFGPTEDYACEHGHLIYFRWQWPIYDGIEEGDAVVLDNTCPICSGEDDDE